MASMESLQLAQMLADLSDLNAAVSCNLYRTVRLRPLTSAVDRRSKPAE
jgi:hypothetical protein